MQLPEEGRQTEMLDSAAGNCWQDRMAQSCGKGGSDWTLGNIFYRKDGQTLGQVADAPCIPAPFYLISCLLGVSLVFFAPYLHKQ